MFDAADKNRTLEHQELLLQKRIDALIEEYRLVNRRFFNAIELNDMRRHLKAMDQSAAFAQMLAEEIEIIERYGPRPAPWWSSLDGDAA